MPRTTRRDFAKAIAAAGVAVSAGAQPQDEAKPNAFGTALAEMTRAQFGQHLSDDEMARVRKDFQEYAPFIERFRNFPLKNADEPDFTFHALTDRW